MLRSSIEVCGLPFFLLTVFSSEMFMVHRVILITEYCCVFSLLVGALLTVLPLLSILLIGLYIIVLIKCMRRHKVNGKSGGKGS